jgi:hypothetical protein
MKKLRNIIIGLLSLPFIFEAAYLIHETGHALITVALGGWITFIDLFNGMRIYPRPEPSPYDTHHIFNLGYYHPDPTDLESGLIRLAGVSATTLVGLVCLVILAWLRPQKPWLRIPLAMSALLLPLDLLAYSIFPVVGLRHGIFFGERVPEPLIGAVKVGLSPAFYFLIIIVFSLLYYTAVVFVLSNSRFAIFRLKYQ